MKFLSMFLLISFCLVTVAGAGPADRVVKVKRLDADVQRLSAAPAKDVAACQLGNLSTPVYAIEDWIWGGESYYYVFDAEPDGCECLSGTNGFSVESVHMFMQFSADDVPSSIDLYGSLNYVELNAATQCWEPAEEICTTPFYTMTIDQPGLYDISLPMEFGATVCMAHGYKYAIGVYIDTVFDSQPDLITDDVPVGCTSWNDYGAGLEDLMGYDLPGEVVMYVDVACCATPVNSDATSFGGIKALFR